MDHPLHKAVANRIAELVVPDIKLVRDPACGGAQQIPLFVGKRKARDTRMCCVDLLLISGGHVRAIVEIEETGFLPTKICGKFLQAGLADHFIHDGTEEGPLPYAKRVLFVQVLDGSACLKDGGRKEQQARLIESEIRKLLPLRGLTDYKLLFVNGPGDQVGLDAVGIALDVALAEPGNQPDREFRMHKYHEAWGQVLQSSNFRLLTIYGKTFENRTSGRFPKTCPLDLRKSRLQVSRMLATDKHGY